MHYGCSFLWGKKIALDSVRDHGEQFKFPVKKIRGNQVVISEN